MLRAAGEVMRRRWWLRRVDRCARRSGAGWSAAELVATAAVVDARRRHADTVTAGLPAPRPPQRTAVGRDWVAQLDRAAASWSAADVSTALELLRFRLAVRTWLDGP
jgi:hypothetical protein